MTVLNTSLATVGQAVNSWQTRKQLVEKGCQAALTRLCHATQFRCCHGCQIDCPGLLEPPKDRTRKTLRLLEDKIVNTVDYLVKIILKPCLKQKLPNTPCASAFVAAAMEGVLKVSHPPHDLAEVVA